MLVRLLDWVGVAAWLRSLDVEEKVVELVEKERVPGGQLVHMTIDELKSDLGMTTLQAKRVMMNMDGLVSTSFASLSSGDGGLGGEGERARPAALVENASPKQAQGAQGDVAKAEAGGDTWDPLMAEGGAGGLGDVNDVRP